MRKIVKRKFRDARQEFKRDLVSRIQGNKALAMLIVETYSAWSYRLHILKIWEMFKNPDFKKFEQEYSKTLFGKCPAGEVSIWRSLYFSDRDLHDKYERLIPERLAMGDALGIAYKELKKVQNESVAKRSKCS